MCGWGLYEIWGDKTDLFELFIDLHHFTIKLTLKRHLKIHRRKNISAPKTMDNTNQTSPRVGKHKNIKTNQCTILLNLKGTGSKPSMILCRNPSHPRQRKTTQNLSKQEQALKNLWPSHRVVIRMADKGGGIVVQDYEEYQGEALNILSNNEYYTIIKKDPFKGIQEELNIILTSAMKEGILSKKKKYFI